MVAACGRVDFQPLDGGAGDGGDGGDGGTAPDALATTGPAGARWLQLFGDNYRSPITGRNGELFAARGFVGSLTFAGTTVTGQASVRSSAMAHFDAGGSVVSTWVFDAGASCELRAIAIDDDAILLAGLTRGAAFADRGICSIAASNQDPIVLRVAADGTESLVTRWTASGQNAQLWSLARYSSGELITSGVYSGNLTVDAPLPAAMADPNLFVASPSRATATSARWSDSVVSPSVVFAGPIDALGSRAFIMGSFQGSPDVLGTPLTSQGTNDGFVARIDEDGSVRWVKQLGSPAYEPDYGNLASVLAMPDGSVMVGYNVPGDITIDGRPFPVAAGDGLLLHLDASGTLVDGRRFPSSPTIARIGATVYASFDVTAPFAAGDSVHVPQATDAIVVELSGLDPVRLVSVVGGAGDQFADGLVPIADDALGISGRTTGALTFGATSLDTGAQTNRYVATLGTRLPE